MSSLSKTDLHYILSRIPRDVVELLKAHPGVFMAGGIIRALIAQETPNDIDLFGRSKEQLEVVADALIAVRKSRGEKARKHTTANAITVITQGRLPVQFITRWVFDHPDECAKSFDFTVCQAVIWHEEKDGFSSTTHENFYPDLAARRLVYTSPHRNEDVGGSLLRVLKYARRGYSVQVQTLGAVCARLLTGVDRDKGDDSEEWSAQVITGLLREVDPLLQIDGVELADEDEHNPERVK